MHFIVATQRHITWQIDMPFAHVKGCNLLLLFSMELVFIVIRFIAIIIAAAVAAADVIAVMILHC